jgi:FkbM family methyltransferase
MKPQFFARLSRKIRRPFIRIYRHAVTLRKLSLQKTYILEDFITFSPAFLAKSLKLNIKGIIQVGAHLGQEIDDFLSIDKNMPIIAFEPNKRVFNLLCEKFEKYPNINTICMAIGSESKESVLFYIASNEGQSSSLLKPQEHLLYEPDVTFLQQVNVKVTTLDSCIGKTSRYNFLVIDAQGYEFQVLQGAKRLLNDLDYIFLETNASEVYAGCKQFTDIDAFLRESGFHCTHIRWFRTRPWGDALYIRNPMKSVRCHE